MGPLKPSGHTAPTVFFKSFDRMRERIEILYIYLPRDISFVVSLALKLIICVTGFPYDLRLGQRHGTHHEPDWYDASAVSLGWMSAVPCSNAAGLPC